MFISYAQNFEDVMLWRALKHVRGGFYVDVGAQDPVTDSVSRAFYERGWRGIHVEPSAHYAALLRQGRPDETVIEAAVGSADGSVTYFELKASGFGTCDSEIAAGHAAKGSATIRRTVPAVTLASVFEMCGDRQIHWLKIDVEGFEDVVLRGWGPSPARPWILVVESVHPLTRADIGAPWEGDLARLGYRFVYFDGLNRFYVADQHPELAAAFATGPNVFDDFALSGTASAPFCAVLNEKIASFARVMEDQRLRLIEYAHNLRHWHNSDREAWAIEQAEVARYVASLKEWGAGAEAYAKSLEAERDARLRAQDDADRTIASMAARLAAVEGREPVGGDEPRS